MYESLVVLVQRPSTDFEAFQTGVPGLYSIDCIPSDGYDPGAPLFAVDPGINKPIVTDAGDFIRKVDFHHGPTMLHGAVYNPGPGRFGRRRTRRRMIPSNVDLAQNLRAAAGGLPRCRGLVERRHWLLVKHLTLPTIGGFYGSRTWRSLRFRAYSRRQRIYDTVVNGFAPDPRTVIAWGANFYGRRADTGEVFGCAPARALRRRFALKRRVVLVNEYNTSKKSHCCGADNQFLPGRVVRCTACNSLIDRDVNGARNIRAVWDQHCENGMRPPGLEIPAGSPWMRLEDAVRSATRWNLLPSTDQPDED